MGVRAWLLRDAIVRIVAGAPRPPATWPSVVRRVAIIVACVLGGLAIGDVHLGVLAAFGALQAAMVELVLPWRSLAGLLIRFTAVSTVTVLVAMLVGGTWWAVVALAAVAYVFGCTAGFSPIAATLGINALALAVIFAGMPRPWPQAWPDAIAVGAGLVVQAAGWLICWRWERRWSGRHAIANKIRCDVEFLRGSAIEGRALIATHAQTDAIADILQSAGLTGAEDRRMRELFSATVAVTRALVAWMVLRVPPESDRIAAGVFLQRQAARLDAPFLLRPRIPADARASGMPIDPSLADCLGELQAAVDAELNLAQPIERALLAPAVGRSLVTPAKRQRLLSAMGPRGVNVRHGLRMAVGIAVAESASLLLAQQHSFWLPLTVVFTLRPDWAFTVIRGLDRTVGNLVAVIVLPPLLAMALAAQWPMLIGLALLAAIAVRWFQGNYAVASFGLAGTVLLLDYALNPAADLFWMRIASTAAGAVLALIVSLAIPTWSSSDGPQQARQLGSILRGWHRHLQQRAGTAGDIADADLDGDVAAARHELIRFDQTAVGALLEPRRGQDAAGLALLAAAASREVLALIAVTYAVMSARPRPIDADVFSQACVHARLDEAVEDFHRAETAYQHGIASTMTNSDR